VLWDVLKMFLQFNQKECHVLKACGLEYTHPLLQATMKKYLQNTVAHNLSLKIYSKNLILFFENLCLKPPQH
jgi:hypothetical protein